MSLSPGQLLHNRYRIETLIGQGGFGAVYRAEDITLNRACAVKENLGAGPETQRQFAREAAILARLRHPNLPGVTDHFTLPGQGQYLVMEFIEGRSLADIVAELKRPLRENEALPWLDQICQALTYLHRCRPAIIHRDVKPQNIIITPAGRAILVDFGIAKLYDDTHRPTTTAAKAVTSGYSPPEQYGQSRTDPRSDLYSLGATFYFALTGQNPTDAIDRLVHQAALPSPRQFNAALKPGLEQAILKATALDPAQRFQSVDEFRQALTRPVPGRASAKTSFGWSLLGLGLAVLLGVVGLALIVAVSRWRGDGAPPLVTQLTPVTPTAATASNLPLTVPTFNPELANYYNNRGTDAYDQRDYNRALQLYNEAIKLNANNGQVFYNRGLTYYQTGRYDQAIADYSHALELNPQYVEAYYGRAMAREMKKDYPQAIADYKRVLNFDNIELKRLAAERLQKLGAP